MILDIYHILPLFCCDFTFDHLFGGYYGPACADSLRHGGCGRVSGLSEDDPLERPSGNLSGEADFSIAARGGDRKGSGTKGRGVDYHVLSNLSNLIGSYWIYLIRVKKRLMTLNLIQFCKNEAPHTDYRIYRMVQDDDQNG